MYFSMDPRLCRRLPSVPARWRLETGEDTGVWSGGGAEAWVRAGLYAWEADFRLRREATAAAALAAERCSSWVDSRGRSFLCAPASSLADIVAPAVGPHEERCANLNSEIALFSFFPRHLVLYATPNAASIKVTK